MKSLIICILTIWIIQEKAYSAKQDTIGNNYQITDSTTLKQRIKPIIQLDDNQMYYIENIKRHKSKFFDGFIIYARANDTVYRIISYSNNKRNKDLEYKKIKKNQKYKFPQMHVSSLVLSAPVMHWITVMKLRDAKVFLSDPRYFEHILVNPSIYKNYISVTE